MKQNTMLKNVDDLRNENLRKCSEFQDEYMFDLSIIVPVYNHEHYIKQALDSIFSQITTYSFEVLVGEDCSTDNSREVLRNFEAEHTYPNLKIYYRDHNMSDDIYTNNQDLRRRSAGKYIITLDGDDYWIDKSKIQQQIDFLENNQNYIAVAHNCIVVDDFSIESGAQYPECKENDYTFEHFASGILPGQTATLMMRNFFRNNINNIDKSLVEKKMIIGDRRICFTLLCNGNVYCIQKKMSAYRYVINKGSSFSATHIWNFEEDLKLTNAYIEYAYKTNNKRAILCSEFVYASYVMYSLVLRRAITIKDAIVLLYKIKNKVRIFLALFCASINKFIFRKNFFVRYL